MKIPARLFSRSCAAALFAGIALAACQRAADGVPKAPLALATASQSGPGKVVPFGKPAADDPPGILQMLFCPSEDADDAEAPDDWDCWSDDEP